jgi:hypothetical protein
MIRIPVGLLVIWVKCVPNTAPEVMCKQSHSYAVDYFALGVITYEFMMGKVLYE